MVLMCGVLTLLLKTLAQVGMCLGFVYVGGMLYTQCVCMWVKLLYTVRVCVCVFVVWGWHRAPHILGTNNPPLTHPDMKPQAGAAGLNGLTPRHLAEATARGVIRTPYLPEPLASRPELARLLQNEEEVSLLYIYIYISYMYVL